MKVITYHVTLLEPALVTSLQGDPNSAVAFEYVPGSVLRGALIGKYLSAHASEADDQTLRRLFFDGTTRYLNGYPLDMNNRPGLPVPRSWQQAKHAREKKGMIFDFAVEKPEDEQQQWQTVRDPFYTQANKGEEVWLFCPRRTVAVHTQRTPRFGRAVSEYRLDEHGQVSGRLLRENDIAGAVYRYEALAAGQTFQAAIICDQDEDEPALRALLKGHVTLGGSRSGGYGRAEISLVSKHDRAEDASEEAEEALEDKLIVTLQSDLLLRDARGQFAVDPNLVGQVLGTHLRTELMLEDAFLESRTIGGFNRKWGLPLPQALAMQMGSVLVFRDPGCDRALLAHLEARGIGERRAEGFGRIAFNRQRVAKLTTLENAHQKYELPVFIREPEARLLAGQMVERMLRQRLDEHLLAAAKNFHVKNPPSGAQISRLRSIVLAQLQAATLDTSTICQFLQSVKARGSARRQFERSTINNMPLLRWLTDKLKCGSNGPWTMDDAEWRGLLGLDSSAGIARIGDMSAEIDDGLRLEYVLRLIDLVLACAAKEHGKEN
jgi:CRISPR-associated protein Csx10